jgi:O-methyltransferase
MSSSLGLTANVVDYLRAHNPPEHPVLARCRAETESLGRVSGMQISPEQGAFMILMAQMVGARRAVEVGVFTGYSSTAVALAMQAMHGAKAHLLACDVSEDWTSRARGYWQGAGVADIVELKIAPAVETLDARLAAGDRDSYDFAFIDADKVSYPGYYERCLELLRPGGVMLFDNMLWSGAVADNTVHDHDTEALRAVAKRAQHDDRVDESLIAVGDGLLICRKR